jgi:hypothetical protein
MKSRVAHIIALCAVLSFLAGCSCGGPRVIPRGKMAEIYADMLIADQWVLDNPGTRSKADTSLVYEPIFNSYGYTTEDYRASVGYYMKDPERYAKILRSTTDILDGKIATLQELKRIEDRMKAMAPYQIDPFRLYYTRSVERLWESGDSVSVEVDSLVPVLEMHLHETSDTLFDGPRVLLKSEIKAVDETVEGAEVAEVAETAEVAEEVETQRVQEPSEVKKSEVVVRERKLFSRALDSLKIALDSLKRK